MVLGLVLRGWATRVLGASYTQMLRVAADQQVVQQGPYQVIRHPGYLGTLLVWLGAAVALADWAIVSVVSIVMLHAYRKRMEAEERMLLDTFGDEYRTYTSRTRRLVPFLC
jgi:protein-S-isoprenylcysteine O-methyltransferase Ste14